LTKPQTVNKDAPIRAELRRIILERIVHGEFAPGMRIKEARLAEELGASRTPLREALINLEQEGFVRSELAHGFTVEPLSGREMRESYPILWTLEALALRSSGNAVHGLLERLAAINAALANAAQAEDRLRLDKEWHETLLSRCPNRRLNGMISHLRTVVRRYEHLFMSEEQLVSESVDQHQQIIEALRARDIEKAAEILTANWRVTMELLLVRLGEP
jgi:DNA-binding GntR family transcriptional regulator